MDRVPEMMMTSNESKFSYYNDKGSMSSPKAKESKFKFGYKPVE